MTTVENPTTAEEIERNALEDAQRTAEVALADEDVAASLYEPIDYELIHYTITRMVHDGIACLLINEGRHHFEKRSLLYVLPNILTILACLADKNLDGEIFIAAVSERHA